MRKFTVVLTIADKYDRYTSDELIPEIERYIDGLDLKVESGSVQMTKYPSEEEIKNAIG